MSPKSISCVSVSLALWTVLWTPHLCNLPVASATATVPLCYQGYTASEFEASFPDGCPAACAYRHTCEALQGDDYDFKYQCVASVDCQYLLNAGIAYDGSVPLTCIGNEVIGCHITSNDSETCAVCESGWDKEEDGTCSSMWSQVWLVFIPFAGILLCWAIYDFSKAHFCTPTSNAGALGEGLRFRFRTKVRKQEPGYPLYELWSFPLHSKPIMGPDQTLFMNWFLLVGLMSVWLLSVAVFYIPDHSVDGINDLCAVIGYYDRRLTEVGEGAPLDPVAARVLGAGSAWQGWQPGGHRRKWITAMRMLSEASNLTDTFNPIEIENSKSWAGLSYVGTLVITILFMWHQRRLQDRLLQDHFMMHYYAFEAVGFPSDATDHEELHNFFSDAIKKLAGVDVASAAVAEISICYDYAESEAQVQALIDAHLLQAQAEYDANGRNDKWAPSPKERNELKRLSKGQNAIEDGESSQEGQKGLMQHAVSTPTSRIPCGFILQALSYAMLGADIDWLCLKLRGYSMPAALPDPSQAVELLNSLPSSGTVVVVLSSETLVNGVLRAHVLPENFRDEHQISVRRLQEEPLSMRWAAYARHTTFWWNVLMSAGQLLVAIMLWTALYYPWAQFSWAMVNDASNVALAINTIVGLVIALGNAMLSAVIVFLSERVGFRHESTMRKAQLFVIVPCVILNVLSDFAVTVRIAYLKYATDLPDGSTDIQYNFGMMLLQGELWDLLVPGYVLLPYIAEPVCTIVMPFWIATWRVKGDLSLCGQDAERFLMCAPMDIINPYLCDLIVITATLVLTFLSPAAYHWMLWAAMLVFVLATYSVARYRMLRHNSMTFYSTCGLHHCECYLWALPLGCLAACWGTQYAEAGKFWQAVRYASEAFTVHVLFHLIFVALVVPMFHTERRSRPKPYAEEVVNVPATYRNTNPVEVLKSQYAPTQVAKASEAAAPWLRETLTFCMRGKEHLQPHGFADDDGDDDAYVSRFLGSTSKHMTRTSAATLDVKTTKSGATLEPVVVGRALDLNDIDRSPTHANEGLWTYVCINPAGVGVVQCIDASGPRGLIAQVKLGDQLQVCQQLGRAAPDKVVWLQVVNPSGYVPEVGSPALQDGGRPAVGSADTRHFARLEVTEAQGATKLGKRFLVNPEYEQLVPVYAAPGLPMASGRSIDPGSMVKLLSRVCVYLDGVTGQPFLEVSDLDPDNVLKGWIREEPARNGRGLLASFKAPFRLEHTWAIVLHPTRTSFSVGLGPERADRKFTSTTLQAGAFEEAYEKMVTTDITDGRSRTWIRLKHAGWIAEVIDDVASTVELVQLETVMESWTSVEVQTVEVYGVPSRSLPCQSMLNLSAGLLQPRQKAKNLRGGELFIELDSGWIPVTAADGKAIAVVEGGGTSGVLVDVGGSDSSPEKRSGKRVVKKRPARQPPS